MKNWRQIFLLLCGLLQLHQASANSNISNEADSSTVSYCYAYAMIGKDTVINSRLGLLPEELIQIAVLSSPTTTGPRYSTVLLKTILDAFLWQESAQNYAHSILENCDDYKV